MRPPRPPTSLYPAPSSCRLPGSRGPPLGQGANPGYHTLPRYPSQIPILSLKYRYVGPGLSPVKDQTQRNLGISLGTQGRRGKEFLTLLAVSFAGEVFYATSPEKFTFQEAANECRRLGARLATTGQLYLAWQGGMDMCSAGWLADRSVRYPISKARPNCGGNLLGVRTVYLHANQTGYPDPSSRYDAICYTGGFGLEAFRWGACHRNGDPEDEILEWGVGFYLLQGSTGYLNPMSWHPLFSWIPREARITAACSVPSPISSAQNWGET